LATGFAAPFAPAVLRARARRGKENAARLGERLGHASAPRPPGSLVWLHGASVGESLSLLPLIDALRRQSANLAILVTSGTVASADIMAQRLPEGVIHQFAPIDAPPVARRFMRYWRPTLTVFVESEVWPNLILEAKTSGSRLALVSARLSASSLHGWGRFAGAARALFSAFDRVMAQDEATAAGLARLGARDDGRLNLKRLGAPPPVDAAALAALRAISDRPVLLAASTHPGEDEIVIDAFRRTSGRTSVARLVIAPRHPARASDIEALARAAGFSTALRSRGETFGSADVYVADTLGELGLWYSLARIALIGGSLRPGPGGHNPVEAAQLGCPILTGPYVDNWRDIYADLFAANAALLAKDAPALAGAFDEALRNPDGARAQASQARHVVAVDHVTLNTAAERLISLTV
jgi:3-deoxy-D-manno-octulosonic-acid transferase